jgi:hypothetical protein
MERSVERHPDLIEKLDVLLVDADIMVYELAFSAEYTDDEGQRQVRGFEYIHESIERFLEYLKIRLDCQNLELFLTGEGNFRKEVAVTQEYKGKRSAKPFHYDATRSLLEHVYQAKVVHGMEADDWMSYQQTVNIKQDINSCIVSRDKDLMMVEGWHYQWMVGRQPEKLSKATKLGTLDLGTAKKRKLRGDGLRWFYAQVLMGDVVDNIPGLQGVGDVAAWNALKDCQTEQELFSAVRQMYHDKQKDDAYLMEQCYLLWMVREINNGVPVMYKPPVHLED